MIFEIEDKLYYIYEIRSKYLEYCINSILNPINCIIFLVKGDTTYTYSETRLLLICDDENFNGDILFKGDHYFRPRLLTIPYKTTISSMKIYNKITSITLYGTSIEINNKSSDFFETMKKFIKRYYTRGMV